MRALNQGERPSQLELGRRLVGEVEGPMDPDYARRVASVVVEPFDWEAIRARSERLVDPPPPPAPVPWWRRLHVPVLVPAFAAAAAAVVLLQPDAGNRVKGGGADLGFYVLRDGTPLLGDPDLAWPAGERLQLNYTSAGAVTMVLLSVDGVGRVSRWFPAEGSEPVPVVPGGRHVLDASIILDDAPGPEVFVAAFDVESADEVERRVLEVWGRGGLEALLDWDGDDPLVATLVIEKR